MSMFIVIQQGGSSMERYLSVQDSQEEAEAFKKDCWDNGAFHTSDVIPVPQVVCEALTSLTDEQRGAVFDFMEAIAGFSAEL